MFKHYDKLLAQGAAFDKNNELNQHMVKLKSNRNDMMVNCHPSKSTFQKMQTICLRGINVDRFVTKRMRGNSNTVGEMANEELQSGDNTENYLNNLLKEFRMDKENLKEIKLNTVNGFKYSLNNTSTSGLATLIFFLSKSCEVFKVINLINLSNSSSSFEKKKGVINL